MGLLGLEDGHLFGAAPRWVDLRKAPGRSSDSAAYGDELSTLRSMVSLEFFFMSPNLVWFIIAVGVYVVWPYDMEAASVLRADWVASRAVVNAAVTFVFCGFWSVTLYKLQWARRKYDPDNLPSMGLLLHNLFYTSLGTLQYTIWECVAMHLWATGKVEYVSDEELLASPVQLLQFAFWVLAIPILREIHFYIGHRFIHIYPLYKFIHVVHHRNIDTEPFSGISMSPVEHLLYFSGGALVLFVRSSPFLFMWIGQHALLSPAAAHSGYEDAWQSDQFHYIHHANYSCNFGGWSIPVDKWFGTHRDRLPEGTAHSKKNRKSYVPEKKAFVSDSLLTWNDFTPAPWLALYHACLIPSCLAVIDAVQNPSGLFGSHASLTALQFTFAPIVLALVLYSASSTSAKSRSWRFPFDKEPALIFIGHVILALVFACFPVYATILKLIEERN